MSLEKRMNEMIRKYKIKRDSLLDQHFMIDENIIKKIVSSAEIRDERVVEIGSGLGFVTRELVKTKGKITTIEIDENLEKIVREIKNIKTICGNALDIIQKINFDKLVSNTPYSICEPLIQILVRKKFKKALLSVPKAFGYRLLNRDGIGLLAQIFFEIKILFEIPKEAFRPKPNVNTVFITLEHRKKVYYKKNIKDFILKELVLQQTKKLKNALVEAIINAEKLLDKSSTKRKSKELINNLKLNNFISEQKIKDINLKALVDIINDIEI